MCEGEEEVEKVVLCAEELAMPPRSKIPCPVAGCLKVLPQPSALRIHMNKTHKIVQVEDKPSDNHGRGKQFYCPVTSCLHNMDSGSKYFTTKANLRAHYLRVHAEKQYVCDACNSAFGLERDLRRHQTNSCGQEWRCEACQGVFLHRTSLITHCRVQGHPLPFPPEAVQANSGQRTTENDCEVSLQTSRQETSRTELTGQDSCDREQEIHSPHTGVPVSDTTASMSCEPSDCCVKSEHQPKVASRKSACQLGHKSAPQTSLPCSGALTCSGTIASTTKPFTPILPKPGFIILPCDTVRQAGPGAPSVITANSMYVVFTNPATEQCTLQGRENNLVAIAPKPGLPRATECHCQKSMYSECSTQTDSTTALVQTPRSHRHHKVKVTATTQTHSPRYKRTVAETQTTGDFILRRAMQSADLPTQRESRASQVSPRAKLKRTYDEQSCQTTSGPRPRRKRGRKSQKGGAEVSVETVSHDSVVSESLLWPVDFSDNQTQTMALLEDLQERLAESISTQTLESYLAGAQPQGSNTESCAVQTSVTDTQTVNPVLHNLLTQRSSQHPATDYTHASNYVPSQYMNRTRRISTGTDPLFSGESSDHALSLIASDGTYLGATGLTGSHAHTQTSVATPSVETQTHTPLEDLNLPDFLSGDGSYMNMETQTTMDNMFDQLLSSMETQTNTDDILTEFGLSHIETQTTGIGVPLHDLSTVETQTTLQSRASSAGMQVQLADMETQTRFPSLTFSSDLTDSHTQTTWRDLESFFNP